MVMILNIFCYYVLKIETEVQFKFKLTAEQLWTYLKLG